MSIPLPAPAPSSTDGRGRPFFALQEFWLGLTTPDVRALYGAALLIVAAVSVASFLAREDRVEHGVAADWLDPVQDDFARASFYALQGASRQATGPGPTVVFVGPSALRFWLPPPTEANALLRASLGESARGVIMCGNAQSYATSAALIERFGWNFSGTIVVAVDRNMIAREPDSKKQIERLLQPRQLGFMSARMQNEAAALEQPIENDCGWSLWDRRSFYFHSYLGLGAWVPDALRPSYSPHWGKQPWDTIGSVRDEFKPLDRAMLERHLAMLSRLANDSRRAGRAKLLLVETPWLDQYEPSARSSWWAKGEAAYAARREAWARENGVRWLNFAESFSATRDDFVDIRHIASPALRRHFVEEVARALKEEAAP